MVQGLTENNKQRSFKFCEFLIRLVKMISSPLNWIRVSFHQDVCVLWKKRSAPFFHKTTVNGISYLNMLINCLFPQQEEKEHHICQEEGAPPHSFLNEKLLFGEIGWKGAENQALHHWSPRSPIYHFDFFLWVYVKDKVLPALYPCK